MGLDEGVGAQDGAQAGLLGAVDVVPGAVPDEDRPRRVADVQRLEGGDDGGGGSGLALGLAVAGVGVVVIGAAAVVLVRRGDAA